MSTKFFSDGAVHAYFNPYENPYQAFMNYMNVLSDFEIRLNIICPVNDHDAEVNRLSASIETKDHLISELQEKLTKYEKKGRTARPKAVKAKTGRSTTAAVKKAVALKDPAKKAALQGSGKKGHGDKDCSEKSHGDKDCSEKSHRDKDCSEKDHREKNCNKECQGKESHQIKPVFSPDLSKYLSYALAY